MHFSPSNPSLNVNFFLKKSTSAEKCFNFTVCRHQTRRTMAERENNHWQADTPPADKARILLDAENSYGIIRGLLLPVLPPI